MNMTQQKKTDNRSRYTKVQILGLPGKDFKITTLNYFKREKTIFKILAEN